MKPVLPHGARLFVTLTLGGVLAGAHAGVWADECATLEFQGQAGATQRSSDLTERDATGRVLVREHGHLPGVVLGLSASCGPWQASLRATGLAGDRRYDGQTSSGLPVVSSSALRQQHLTLEGRHRFEHRFGGRLEAVLAVEDEAVSRTLRSVAQAQGYPEHYHWLWLRAGPRVRGDWGAWPVAAGLYASAPLQSSLRVALPGRDPMTLGLGRARALELELEATRALSTEWQLRVGARARGQDVAAGPTGTVNVAGLPVGVAWQPAFRTVEREVSLQLEKRF